MLILNKIDLTLIRQGLLHVYNFHNEVEKIEYEVVKLKSGYQHSIEFHATRKARAKNLIDAIDTNLENLATKEKAES